MPFTTISELNGYFAKKFADDFAKLPPMSSEVFASPYGEDGLRFGENIHVIMCGDGRLLFDRHALWKIEPFSWLVREVFRAIAGKMDAVVRYCFLSEGKCGHLDYMPLFLSQFIMALKDIANAVRAEEAAVNGSLKGGLTMAGQTQDQQIQNRIHEEMGHIRRSLRDNTTSEKQKTGASRKRLIGFWKALIRVSRSVRRCLTRADKENKGSMDWIEQLTDAKVENQELRLEFAYYEAQTVGMEKEIEVLKYEISVWEASLLNV